MANTKDTGTRQTVQQIRSSANMMGKNGISLPARTEYLSSSFTGQLKTASRTAPVLQRVPTDFDILVARGLPAKTGLFRTSHWQPLLDAIEAYRVLDPANHKDRKRLLNVMAVSIMRWKEARGLPGVQVNTLDDEEQAKAASLPALELQIQAEFTELGASAGGLVPNTAVVARPDPRLTVTRSVRDGRIKGYFFENVRILNDAAVDIGGAAANTSCRVEIKKEGGPNGLNAEEYYWVRPAPEEDAVSGTVAEFPPGWVERQKVQRMNLDKDASKNLKYEDRTDPNLFPLFPSPPVVDDVMQSGLGDCYLLAAVLAVVRNDPHHFLNSMHDNGNGVVTVRLHEITFIPARTITPVEIHVNKSVVVKKKPATGVHPGYNKNTLWVEILEKAYAAAGFTGKSPKTSPSTSPGWADISGGDANIALTHITGVWGTFEKIESINPNEKDPMLIWTQRGGIQVHLHQINPAFVATWNNIRNNVRDRLLALPESKDEVRMDDVKMLIRNMVQAGAFQDAIIDFLNNNQLYPGKRGTGLYTEQQLEIMNSIANDVDAHKKIVVGSKEHMKRGQNNTFGRSANESVHAGLAGPHGYEVISYAPLNFRALPAGNVFWIKLRNPWGDTGRKYVDKITNLDIPEGTTAPFNAKAEKTDNPEFSITLDDLTKRFNYISVIP